MTVLVEVFVRCNELARIGARVLRIQVIAAARVVVGLVVPLVVVVQVLRIVRVVIERFPIAVEIGARVDEFEATDLALQRQRCLVQGILVFLGIESRGVQISEVVGIMRKDAIGLLLLVSQPGR